MPNIIKPTGINQLWAAGGTKIDPGATKTNIGWVVELPPYQYQNWLDNRQDTFIAHANQHGIPEWDTETEYQGNLSYTQGSDGIIYKCIQTHTNLDPANPLNSAFWVRAFEPFGSVAVVENALAAHLANYATLSGISNPVAARNNLSVWSKTESDVRYAFKAGTNTQVFSVGAATLGEHAVRYDQVLALLTGATEVTAGIVQLATIGDTSTGTNDTKAITPLKAAAVYLSKAGNLAGLTNLATARSNLGLTSTATTPLTDILLKADNLAGLTNQALARSNLGLSDSGIYPSNTWLVRANNLADLPNVAGARANLGLTSTATTALSLLMQKSENLAGLTNVPQARINLGLSDSVLYPSNTWLVTGANLADLPNKQTARNNLGLQALATWGQAGVNAAGVSGQFLNFTSLLAANGYQYLPSGLLMQWGITPVVGQDTIINVPFTVPFSSQVFTVQVSQQASMNITSSGNIGVTNINTSSFQLENGGNGVGQFLWFAVGV